MRTTLNRSAAVHAALWLVGGCLLGWAILRVFGLERGFLTVVLVAWTPLAVPAALLALVLAYLARRPGPGVATALAAALLLAAVLPRAVGSGHHPDSADGPELRVLSANLSRGSSAAAERTVELARELGVHLLCVQELTPAAARALGDAGLDKQLPHFGGAAHPGTPGTGIYSVDPLRSQGSLQPIGSWFEMPAAVARPPGAPRVEIGCVHPAPPTGSAAVHVWREGLRALPAAGGSRLRVLLGDFNATLDHAEVRRLLESGYVDAAAATGRGLIPTWPARILRPPVTIDRVLADERIGIVDYAVHGLDGSDHRAVSAVLTLPRASSAGGISSRQPTGPGAAG